MSAVSPLQRLYAGHAVLAVSMVLMRTIAGSGELTDAKGLPFESSVAGRALALVLLISCICAMLLAIRESWMHRRSWPAWLLGALLVVALARTEQVEIPDLVYVGTALCAFAADRWQRR